MRPCGTLSSLAQAEPGWTSQEAVAAKEGLGAGRTDPSLALPTPAASAFVGPRPAAPKRSSHVTTIELRKQISLFLPVSEWLAIRHEAARRKIPMTELCREWLRPKLERLHEQEAARR